VAVIVYYRQQCASVEVWDAARRRVTRYQRPCGPNDDVSLREGTFGVALAGRRVGWLSTGGGNSLETIVMTATPAHKKPTWVAWEVADEGEAGDYAEPPFGDGTLFAFTVDRVCDEDSTSYPCPPGHSSGDVVASSIWRLGGTGRCPEQRPPGSGCTRVAHAAGELRVLAVDAGRIVARTDTGVTLLTEDGAVLRDFGARSTAAALSGNRLAVRTADSVEVYDADSGQLVVQMPAARHLRVEDLDGDLLVTALGRTVTVRRLSDGRTARFRAKGTAHAQLENAGALRRRWLAGAVRADARSAAAARLYELSFTRGDVVASLTQAAASSLGSRDAG
jgi:hypothetical protein